MGYWCVERHLAQAKPAKASPGFMMAQCMTLHTYMYESARLQDAQLSKDKSAFVVL